MMDSPSERRLAGVLIAAQSVSHDGETQGYGEFVVTLDDQTIDLRLDDGTIWMIELGHVEEAITRLKAWRRSNRS